MEQIIYLDPDDEITTIRERLGRAQTSRVALVIPAQSRTFQNLVNLKLLQRYANQLALELTLITADRTTRDLARLLDIPLRSALGGGEERRGKGVEERRGFSPAPAHSHTPAHPRPPAPAQRFLGYLLLAMLLLLAAGGVVLVLPQATITLSPATDTVSQTIMVKASPDFKTVDLAKGQVPARIVQATLEDVAQLESTGRKQEPAEKATGKVTFTNRSGDTLSIPQGTVVRTSTGTATRFRTTQDAAVEANAFTQVSIAAELPGSVGNVPAWAINQVEGALSFQVVVSNDTPTTGGAEKQVQWVTAADRQRLRDTLLDKLKAAGLAALKKDLKPDDFLAPATLSFKIEDEAFDREVGDINKTVGLRLRVVASALVVPADGLNKLADGAVQNKITAAANLVPGSLKLGTPSDVNVEGTVISFNLEGRVSTTARLDESQIRRDVQGQPVAQARQLLAQKYRLAAEPQIALENALLPDRLPFLTFRIQVKTVK